MRFALAMAAVSLLLPGATAIDNGLGVVPPRGWRSWNAYTCTDSSNTTLTGGNILTDAVMRATMDAVLDKSRSVGGKPTTLASLGYDYVSMDDGWQQCNCSTRQAIDPALPVCSIHTCSSGGCTWHDKDGVPLVNKHRFPHGMKSLVRSLLLLQLLVLLVLPVLLSASGVHLLQLTPPPPLPLLAQVDYGHSLGLHVGSYLNNCICMESKGFNDPARYAKDVKVRSPPLRSSLRSPPRSPPCSSPCSVVHRTRLRRRQDRQLRQLQECD